MNDSLLVIIILTLCNFLIFLALVAIIVRAGRQHHQASFRQIQNPNYSETTEQIVVRSNPITITLKSEKACHETCGDDCACSKKSELAEVSTR
jgi:hypothetical protein